MPTVVSLFEENSDLDLRPIDTAEATGGLFELDANDDLQPITGTETDSFFQLDGSSDLETAIYSTGDAASTFIKPSVSALAGAGGALNIPKFLISGTTVYFGCNATLPLPTISGTSNIAASGDVDLPVAEISGTAGIVNLAYGSAAFRIPIIYGITGVKGSTTLMLPKAQVSSTSGNLGVAAVRLPRVAVNSSTLYDNTTVGTVVLTAMSASATAHEIANGAGTVTLPMLTVRVRGDVLNRFATYVLRYTRP